MHSVSGTIVLYIFAPGFPDFTQNGGYFWNDLYGSQNRNIRGGISLEYDFSRWIKGLKAKAYVNYRDKFMTPVLT